MSLGMSGRASSSQLTGSLSGSGGLSHVYIPYPPLQCSIPGSRGLFYDDGNKLLLSATSDQVFSWKVLPYSSDISPNSDLIREGPILSIRYSLDAKLIAIQRSSQEIQFCNRETGETFSHRSKSESENILGFFWTDCPLCDLVLVKTSGLDLLSCNSETKSLQLVETRKLNVSWYIYTHESRLVLLASGGQCKSFTGYQLSSVGIIRLPRFEMVMAKSEAVSKPVLAAEDVHIVTVYGRIYCFQIDRVAMLLHSYRFYRDAVVQQGSLPIYSSKIAVSVVDNVLLVHQVDAKVVILYDVYADSRAPISAPLPLLFRGFPRSSNSRANSNEVGSSENNSSHHGATVYGDEWTFLVPDLVCDVANKLLWKIHLDLEAISASSSEVPSVIEFLQRRKLEASKAKQLCLSMMRTVILERRPVMMVAKALDVLVTSYSNSIKSGSLLRGHKVEKRSTGVHVGGHLSGSDVTAGARVEKESANRSSNFSTSDSEENSQYEMNANGSGTHRVERENVSGPESSSTDIHPSSSQSQHLGPGYNTLNDVILERQESQLNSAAISPDEMYSSVFAPVDEEMVGDSSYLIAILVEFFRSTSLEKVKVHPNLFVLTTQLLARNQRYAELTLFVINKVLEPSKEVAMQILESSRQNSQVRKLGLDMLRQLSLHHDYVVQLVQDGYYLEALRYARKHKVVTVWPSLFLEAALASNDSQVLAAVIRFFSDFTPGFRSTSDYHTYFRILNDMNNTVVAA